MRSRNPSYLADKRFGHVAPAEVLFDLASWRRVDRIPWGFHYVRIEPVTQVIPPEVRLMWSLNKGGLPSRCDQLVATLALQLRAALIVTRDRDIWDTNVAYDLAKKTGLEVRILTPKQFGWWAERQPA